MRHPTAMPRPTFPSLLPFLLLVALVPACGPHLRWRDHATRAFQVSERCTQGPIVLDLPAAGARWGERVEVRALSPRAIVGRAAIVTDEAPPQDQPFGQVRMRSVSVSGRSETISRADDHPENERCVATAAELSSPAPPSGGGSPTGISPPPGSAPLPPTTTAPPTVGTPAVRIVESADPSETIREHSSDWQIAVVGWAAERSDPDLPSPRRAGANLRVRIWFPEPNDLEGVLFVVEHRVAEPNVTDAEWTAHLRARIAASHRESERVMEASRRRNERCAAHHEDEDCWGPGGYDAYVRSLRAPRPQAVATVAPPAAPRPREPDGPPPPARSEERPPKPSVNADWVPGYWRWSGFTWAWISGRWRVPESDRAQGLTVHAPSAPPPPQVEVQGAAPIAGAVWTPGHWQWNSAAWVWVGGAWQMPPSASATWRAPRWIIDGRGVRFDPGDWVLQVGP